MKGGKEGHCPGHPDANVAVSAGPQASLARRVGAMDGIGKQFRPSAEDTERADPSQEGVLK